MPGSVIRALHTSFHVLYPTFPWSRYYNYSRVIDKQTEVQKGLEIKSRRRPSQGYWATSIARIHTQHWATQPCSSLWYTPRRRWLFFAAALVEVKHVFLTHRNSLTLSHRNLGSRCTEKPRGPRATGSQRAWPQEPAGSLEVFGSCSETSSSRWVAEMGLEEQVGP